MKNPGTTPANGTGNQRGIQPLTITPDQKRFEKADRMVSDGEAWVFYDVGRLSQNYGVHAGVFKRTLSQVTFTRPEDRVYKDWLTAPLFDRLEQARHIEPPTAAQLASLRAARDPAVHIMDAIIECRATDFPGYASDVRLNEKAAHGFERVLASIHGPHPGYLKAIVETYPVTAVEIAEPPIDPAT